MLNLPKGLAFSTAILASAFLLSGTALAARPDGVGMGKPLQISQRPSTDSGSPSGTRKEAAKARLQDVKLKVCEKREAGIQKRSEQTAKMALNMKEKFSTISARVQEYYTTKVLPAGKTAPGYDDLVSDIASKESSVGASLTKAQADISGFSCDGEDPKGQMKAFQTDLRTVKESLKAYRTSVRNLTVAVRSLNGQENRNKENQATKSARPSKTPNLGGNRP